MVKRAVSLLTATILVMGAAIGLAASPAGAAVGPGEDRQLSVPTGWWTYTGVTTAQVTSYLNTNHARLTDIKVTGTGSSQRYTVTMVQNSGAYASGWWWYVNVTPAQVVSLATDNSARATVVQCYNTASGVRCAAIMISNTGANAEGWAFYYGSAAFVDSKVTSTNRLVSYGRIQGTSLYTGVFGSNTGSDATSWWYYRNVTSAQLSSYISTNHARLVDLDRNEDTGRYNAIMYANPAGTRWYWYTGYSSVSALVTKASQLGVRLFDVSPASSSGGRTTWSGLMVENLTAASQQLFTIMSPAIDSGTWGYSLQPLDSGTAASLQSGTVFEPASVLKTVYHYLSINRQESGLPNSTSVTYRLDPNDPSNVGICPDNYSTTATTNLKNADTQMMQVSDNRMTRGVRELYGTSAVNAQIAALGMTNTAFLHNIGCPTASTHNRTTLDDLAKLYGAYDDATDITTTTWRNQFKIRMLNEDNTGYFNSMCPLVQQRANALGKPGVATGFCARISWISKGGSYQYAGSLPANISYATSSMTELPFKNADGSFAPRAYFWGDFVDQMTLNSTAEGTALSNARGLAYRTAMTQYIDAALATW